MALLCLRLCALAFAIVLALGLAVHAAPGGFMNPEELSAYLDDASQHAPIVQPSSSRHRATLPRLARPDPSESLLPLNGVEMPSPRDPMAPHLERLRLNPLLHEKVHEAAALSFDMKAGHLSRNVEDLLTVKDHVESKLRGMSPNRQGRRWLEQPDELRTKADAVDARIEQAKSEAAGYRSIARDHRRQAAVLSISRASAGEYRGLPLPHMARKEHAEHQNLKAGGDTRPREVYAHLILMGDRRSHTLETHIATIQRGSKEETNPFRRKEDDEIIRRLKEKAQSVRKLRGKHEEALAELRQAHQSV